MQKSAVLTPNELSADSAPSAEAVDQGDASLLSPLLRAALSRSRGDESGAGAQGVVIGELLALSDEGATPLVRYAGQSGSAAVRARTTVDLHGQHIGGSVVLVFDQGDADRPIVVGVLRGSVGWPLADPPAQVEVDADGHRMVVNAREQLVFRCGAASITLTKAGKVLIEGSYVLSRSTGVNRIKGGSVQLN
jgi:hypothetical protein